MTTRVVHVNDNIPGAVYIGRGNGRKRLNVSPFANPHKVKGDRQWAIAQFQSDITEGPLRHLLAELPALRGKALACWCRHDGDEATDINACHGDVLVRLLDTYTDQDLRMTAATAGRVCRVCGCTDDNACAGGCWWVEWDLCSACVEDPQRPACQSDPTFAIRAGEKPPDMWTLADIFPWQELDDQYADFVGTRDQCIERILAWRDDVIARLEEVEGIEPDQNCSSVMVMRYHGRWIARAKRHVGPVTYVRRGEGTTYAAAYRAVTDPPVVTIEAEVEGVAG